MRYADYLRWEGWCSIVLGLELALVAFPGLFVSYPAAWAGVLFVPAVLLALGGWAAARRGAPLTAPGRWLTERPLARAVPGRRGLDARRLKRRLAVESTVWVLAVSAWVLLAGSSGLLVFGTGLASAAFGAVQAFAARRRVTDVEAARGAAYVVAARPGIGTPELGVALASPAA